MRALPIVRTVSLVSLVVLFARCGGEPAAPLRAPVASEEAAAGANRAAVDAAFPAAFPRRRANVAESPRGMVVSDAALGTKVGAEMLAAGGNAADAAVAMAFALAVVFPTAGNLGGGGFAVTRSAGASPPADAVQALDLREKAPHSATPGQ
jgi:gamma-glutamyltranspeptidase/glutathione hydrolase